MFRYECGAWMTRCTVFRKKPGTIPHECRASTGLCLWQINLTTPALLGPPSSPIPYVSWGAAVFSWTQQPSCVVVVEIFQGRGKCPAGTTSLRQSDSSIRNWLYSLYLWGGKMDVMFLLLKSVGTSPECHNFSNMVDDSLGTSPTSSLRTHSLVP